MASATLGDLGRLLQIAARDARSDVDATRIDREQQQSRARDSARQAIQSYPAIRADLLTARSALQLVADDIVSSNSPLTAALLPVVRADSAARSVSSSRGVHAARVSLAGPVSASHAPVPVNDASVPAGAATRDHLAEIEDALNDSELSVNALLAACSGAANGPIAAPAQAAAAALSHSGAIMSALEERSKSILQSTASKRAIVAALTRLDDQFHASVLAVCKRLASSLALLGWDDSCRGLIVAQQSTSDRSQKLAVASDAATAVSLLEQCGRKHTEVLAPRRAHGPVFPTATGPALRARQSDDADHDVVPSDAGANHQAPRAIDSPGRHSVPLNVSTAFVCDLIRGLRPDAADGGESSVPWHIRVAALPLLRALHSHIRALLETAADTTSSSSSPSDADTGIDNIDTLVSIPLHHLAPEGSTRTGVLQPSFVYAWLTDAFDANSRMIAALTDSGHGTDAGNGTTSASGFSGGGTPRSIVEALCGSNDVTRTVSCLATVCAEGISNALQPSLSSISTDRHFSVEGSSSGMPFQQLSRINIDGDVVEAAVRSNLNEHQLLVRDVVTVALGTSHNIRALLTSLESNDGAFDMDGGSDCDYVTPASGCCIAALTRRPGNLNLTAATEYAAAAGIFYHVCKPALLRWVNNENGHGDESAARSEVFSIRDEMRPTQLYLQTRLDSYECLQHKHNQFATIVNATLSAFASAIAHTVSRAIDSACDRLAGALPRQSRLLRSSATTDPSNSPFVQNCLSYVRAALPLPDDVDGGTSVASPALRRGRSAQRNDYDQANDSINPRSSSSASSSSSSKSITENAGADARSAHDAGSEAAPRPQLQKQQSLSSGLVGVGGLVRGVKGVIAGIQQAAHHASNRASQQLERLDAGASANAASSSASGLATHTGGAFARQDDVLTAGRRAQHDVDHADDTHAAALQPQWSSRDSILWDEVHDAVSQLLPQVDAQAARGAAQATHAWMALVTVLIRSTVTIGETIRFVTALLVRYGPPTTAMRDASPVAINNQRDERQPQASLKQLRSRLTRLANLRLSCVRSLARSIVAIFVTSAQPWLLTAANTDPDSRATGSDDAAGATLQETLWSMQLLLGRLREELNDAHTPHRQRGNPPAQKSQHSSPPALAQQLHKLVLRGVDTALLVSMVGAIHSRQRGATAAAAAVNGPSSFLVQRHQHANRLCASIAQTLSLLLCARSGSPEFNTCDFAASFPLLNDYLRLQQLPAVKRSRLSTGILSALGQPQHSPDGANAEGMPDDLHDVQPSASPNSRLQQSNRIITTNSSDGDGRYEPTDAEVLTAADMVEAALAGLKLEPSAAAVPSTFTHGAEPKGTSIGLQAAQPAPQPHGVQGLARSPILADARILIGLARQLQ